MNTATAKESIEREKLGGQLYIAAWVIEIFAVMIGIAIALSQVYISFAAMQKDKGTLDAGDYMNIFIAAVPFLMVAVVELTKIPFVGAFYKSVRMRWKLIFGGSLLFLAAITFESALNGFERNFNSLMYAIDRDKKELVATEERMVPAEEYRTKLLALSADKIEKDFADRHAQISGERSELVGAAQDRIKELRGSIQSETIKGLREQIDDHRRQIDSLKQERASELELLKSQHSTEMSQNTADSRTAQRQFQAAISADERELERLRAAKGPAIENAGIFSKGSVEDKYNADIQAVQERLEMRRNQLLNQSASQNADALMRAYRNRVDGVNDSYQKRIAVHNREISRLSAEVSKSIGAKEKDIQSAVDSYQAEILRLEERFKEQQDENEAERDRQLALLANNRAEVATIDDKLRELQATRAELRDKINQKVGDNQVYRIAQWAFGKESAADISRDQVMLVAMVWFGSLALLVAVTGILLALASYVIRDPQYAGERPAKIRQGLPKLIASMRRWVIYRRRLHRKPIIREVEKEVIKEIPIEKVRIVEVPVEVIRKELVHVPFYTNDETLLNLGDLGAKSSQKTKEKA